MKETERGKVSSCMEGGETPSELEEGFQYEHRYFLEH
jgi:hypothetical protein